MIRLAFLAIWKRFGIPISQIDLTVTHCVGVFIVESGEFDVSTGIRVRGIPKRYTGGKDLECVGSGVTPYLFLIVIQQLSDYLYRILLPVKGSGNGVGTEVVRSLVTIAIGG